MTSVTDKIDLFLGESKKEQYDDYSKWEKSVKKIDKEAEIEFLPNSKTILQATYSDSSDIIGEWDKSSETGYVNK